MKFSIRKFLFVWFIFIFPIIAQSAVIQQSVSGKPDLFKTRYLFKSMATIPMGSMPLPRQAILDTANQKSVDPFSIIGVPPVQKNNIKTEVKTNEVLAPSLFLSAVYKKTSLSQVKELLMRYKDIPGGVTLEGTGAGLEEFKKVTYNPENNSFLLNDQFTYQSPVSKYDMKEILKAIQADDRIGVSLGSKDVVYGAVTEGTPLSIQMKLADHFLACVVFACNKWVETYNFPNQYRPQKNMKPGNYQAVYFNFKDFSFAKKGSQIVPGHANTFISLIPLLLKNSGYVPDYDKIEKGEFPKAFENNISHIVSSIEFYQKDARIQHVIAYGQASAFVRSMKANGVSLDSIIKI